ncbi:hypothetical protein SR1949_51630 [Sphaerospermopsis reniformis]|uniref:Uncharacterized protein n=1 Tax=Sphaerospermopsis reniformis TaxID=531300 RepID=A0A480A5C2_9CYAN|nr:hypothetical protein [Sphaerospermopsis reniformis]GCL40029.1 hypothetical protein SR1949_51630 [Sphaerospermopsis reniformis]
MSLKDTQYHLVQNLLTQEIFWEPANESDFTYSAKFNSNNLELHINDFPEENLYTLSIDSIAICNLDDLPNCWHIP